MSTIKSTLRFQVTTHNQPIPASTLPETPLLKECVLTGMPPAEDGTLWIVSAPVFNASEREDLVCFDHVQAIRDAEGKPVGQGGFIRRDGSSGTF